MKPKQIVACIYVITVATFWVFEIFQNTKSGL